MSAKRRYFWCDAPSPLHDARDRAVAAQNSTVDSFRQFAASLGATDFVVNSFEIVQGFLFDGEPPRNSYHWKRAGKDSDGQAFYVPQRRTADGKALRSKMVAPLYTSAPVAVARASGAHVRVVQGNLLCQTTCAWKDDRIFLTIPLAGEAGDPFPEIPSYLTECAKWEMERWFEIGRAGVAGQAVAVAVGDSS